MIEIEPVPLKEDPIERLQRYLLDGRSSLHESAVVMPTSRAVRRLVQLMCKGTPGPAVLPYCFEMKDFVLRCLDSGGYGIVPDELRLPYLQKAVRALDTGKLTELFGQEHARYCEDFIRFASVGRRLLRFYDEVFAEGVGFDDLRMNALYTDYERDVLILEEIASLYRDVLEKDGLTDAIFIKAGFLSSAQENPAFLKRFRRLCILSPGRLSRFESRLLEKASEAVDTIIFLHYEGTAEGAKMSGLVESTAHLPEIEPAPYPAYIEVEEFRLPEEQAGFVMNSILKSTAMGISPEETVVVLPDEGLKRLLYAFDRDGVLNFAMGLDMRDTVFYSLLKSLETMLASSGGDGAYDARAAVNFLGHPFMRGLAGGGYEPFVAEAKRRNRFFVAPAELCMTVELAAACREIDTLFGREEMGFREFCSRIREIVERIMEMNAALIERLRGSPEFTGAERAFFERLTMLGMLPYDPVRPGGSPQSHLAYLNDCLKDATFPHTWGGPVTVMGMLETRGLGFRSVVIPDMNEEFMPPASEKEMFLNTEIRRRVGLPTFLDREALSRAYFNGLLKKADAVFLSYASTEGRRPRSRFIEEIEMQRGGSLKRGPDRWADTAKASPPPAKSSLPAKDGRTLRLIETMVLTPTSLRTYRECRFRFYLRYIKGLREKEEFSESLQRVDLGNIFHSAVSALYGKLFGQSLQRGTGRTEGLDKAASEQAGLFPAPVPLPSWTRLTEELRSRVLKEAEQYDIFRKSPHARLELDVFIDKLRDFVDSERTLFEAGWRPAYIEFPVSMRLEGMRFRGKIDRVDVMREPGGTQRVVIIDYKLSDVSVRERTVLDGDFKEFQLPLYRLMFRETLGGIGVEAVAYYDLKSSFRLKRVFADLTDGDFIRHIGELVAELKDPKKGFEKTEKEQNCRYCSYRDMCR